MRISDWSSDVCSSDLDWKLLEHCHHCSTIIMQNSSHLKRREEIFCNWKGQAASSNRSFWSKPAASMQSCRSCFGIEWALVVGFEVAAWRSRGVPMTLIVPPLNCTASSTDRKSTRLNSSH